jgi:anti-sigma factor RsiW
MMQPTMPALQGAQEPQDQPPVQMDGVPSDVLESFYWKMSLALDGLLDAPERAEFDACLGQYPPLAALWLDWQMLHEDIDELPHAEAAPGFVLRFEARLAQHETEQQRRVMAFSIVSVLLVALLAVAGVIGGVTYLTSMQGPWLGAQLHNLVVLSAMSGAWFGALLDTLDALAGSPQAQALGMMYMLVALVMIFGWVQLLRRSARLSGAIILSEME